VEHIHIKIFEEKVKTIHLISSDAETCAYVAHTISKFQDLWEAYICYYSQHDVERSTQ